MKVIHLKRAVFTAAIGLLLSAPGHAEGPLWEYSAPNPARVSVSSGSTATVHYTVTNRSHRSKNLKLQETSGLSASPCYLATKGSECTLTLTINGNLIPKEGIHSGPVLCEQGNSNQCYPPSEGNLLHITHSSSPPEEGHLTLSQYGVPVSSLALSSGDVGTLVLSNTGGKEVSSLDIQYPFGWQSYFTNNCPALLASQQSCSIVYTIPTPSAVGILNPLTIEGTGANNRIAIPVSIQTMGSLQCWGYNNYGQLGNDTTTDSSTPVLVHDITNAVAITGGLYHTCALLETGAVNCWGYNGFGQLGNDTTTNSRTPVPVHAITNAVAITGGVFHTCALLETGAVKCWGYNGYGQLGNDTTTNSRTPVPVHAITNAVAITGGHYHTCALLETGAVNCWGDNSYGQLGNGTTTDSKTPVPVHAITNAVAITGGRYHTCALLETGAVNCWGDNDLGQLGNGTMTESKTPVLVHTITNAVAITGGEYHACALLSTGAVKCWGFNNVGQLGNGTTTNSNTPETTCSQAGCQSNLTALGIFNHSLSASSCAIVAGP